ncbi:hypothetical protein REPUB_Repub06bG0142800 [Reevesia pubescens]
MSSNSESREIKYTNRGRELRGPRPSPLRVGNSSSTIKKSSSHNNIPNRSKVKPVVNVIYLRSPKIIHVRAGEFMSLVQRLTGKESSTNESYNNPSSTSSASSSDMVTGDHHESMKTMSRRDDHQMKPFYEFNNYVDQLLGLSQLGCVS